MRLPGLFHGSLGCAFDFDLSFEFRQGGGGDLEQFECNVSVVLHQ
jgi:hypothetical protein